MLTKNDIKYFASLKRKKYRRQEGKFLIEGIHLVEECLNSSYFLECVLISDNTGKERSKELLKKIESKKIPVHYLKESQFSKVSDTETSQGIAAVVLMKTAIDYETLSASGLIIALDRISDPGNLGTIIRTAYWFGADSVIISENSVDLYNSKVIRSTQGGLFHLNIPENVNLERTLELLCSNGFNIILLDAKAEKKLGEIEAAEKTVLVFGNEAEGISENLMNKGYDRIRIGGFSDCESLNVAVSSGIVLHYLKTGL